MAILKCKMCGGDLNITADEKIIECEFCGTTQTVPEVSDEKKTNLFNRANRLRMDNEFDKAAGVYESIVSEFPEEAEGYWGLVLCSYGIEYVDDAKTGKKIPTCHRTLTSSVMDDDNFVQACENADVVARSVYREEAKAIDRLQQQIIAVVENEEPYDVFICYKETDDITKQRTEDSLIAQDIYTELIKEGYKVFFSRVTLRDKAGTEYEPYIYAALKSAKIMLAIGTKFDYYDAVWVKNEWSRYISMMADDSSKHLIPCFKNLDAYDIPKEFKNLQALDMGEVTFFKNLTDNVSRVIPKQSTKPVVGELSASIDENSAIDSLLKRAFMFLEDGDWKRAEEYCEKVLDINPECADAYLGKLMAELRIKKQDDLKKCECPFDYKNNYQKAIRFADESLKVFLNNILLTINNRTEINRKEGLYNKALNMFNKGYHSLAIRLFKQIEDYKDSKVLLEKAIGDSESIIQLAKIEINNKYGFINEKGEMVIEPQFDDAEDFSENGLAKVELNGKWGFINEVGEMAIQPQFDYAQVFSKNGLAAVELNGKYGYINETGEMVIQPQFDNVYSFGENSLAAVKLNGKYGYINEAGEFVIEPRFDGAAWCFSENGLAAVNLNGKWGYIDKAGEMVIQPQFDYSDGFSENGLAAASFNYKFGFINEMGEMVIKPQFDYAYGFSKNGLAAVELNDKWGYIDETGEMVIQPQFDDDLLNFGENGLAKVKQNDKWGYINENGEMVIQPQFDYAHDFSENGLAAVEFNGKFGLGFINEMGEMVIKPQFYDTDDFSANGLAAVNLNFKWGYIDETGETIIEPQFNTAYKYCIFSKDVTDKRNQRSAILKQKAEEKRIAEENRIKAQREQQEKYRNAGLCQYCGGSFKGLFTKTCINCGKKKDY